jgi:uncharacterized protein
MKLVLFGATGVIGSRILEEALKRGHHVAAVVRDPTRVHRTDTKMSVIKGDVLDPTCVADSAAGHDAVLCAVGPGADVIVGAAHSLLEALPRAGVQRLVVVGGAGSLEVAPGHLFVNASDFPKEYLDQARANCEALKIYRRNEFLDWTVISPPVWITPGERTGRFRLGGDQLLVDSKGESHISVEDFAVAFLDEVENPRHVRRRFTVAY